MPRNHIWIDRWWWPKRHICLIILLRIAVLVPIRPPRRLLYLHRLWYRYILGVELPIFPRLQYMMLGKLTVIPRHGHIRAHHG